MLLPKSELLYDLYIRGYLKDCNSFANLDTLLLNNKITMYIGFDVTAKSLHVGSLIQIMILRKFLQHGHRIVILFGGGTTKIGDPSFKDKDRPLLSEEVIAENKSGILECIQNFFDPEDKGVMIVDNESWLGELKYIEFLRDIGKHFTVNRMLGMDAIKGRLDREQSLSFIEFNYALLQSYDFLYLYEKYGCVIQCGGSDQWGNIIQGIDLIKRIHKDAEVFGLTTELATRKDGKKMGKTESGAIWLHKDMLSDYDYFQYFRNIPDEDIAKFMKLFTDLNNDEILNFTSDKSSTSINKAKEILAFEVTKICRGEEAAHNALNSVRELFNTGHVADENLIYNYKEEIESNGVALSKILVDVDLALSASEARRLIKSGGVYVEDVLISDEWKKFQYDEIVCMNHTIKIVVGKKKFRLVKFPYS